jgi:hypothetical protein
VTPFLLQDAGALRLFFGAARRRTWDGNAIAATDVVLPPVRGTGQIPVLAWIGPPADQTTPERYRELAEAGFTLSFSWFPDAVAMTKALDVANDFGVRLMINCPELRREPEATVRRFMSHPATAGYYLRDEPSAADFPELGEWARRIRSIDETHPCYLNLFPTYASPAQLGADTYREHVRRFLAEVPVPVLSFDHYPIVGDQLRANWYENLEIIADEAREAEMPFWAFALAVAHDPYPVATVNGLRLQVFSDLAYGARAIQYFTYWTPTSSNWNFHLAPIETDGTRTEVYDRVRQVNEEVQSLAPVFQSAEVIEVGHLGEPLPQGTRRYQPTAPVQQIDTGGRGAVVSRLRGPTQDYLVMVNRGLRETMDVSVEFDEAARVHELPKQGKLRPLERGMFRDSVAPGDVRVFVWRR